MEGRPPEGGAISWKAVGGGGKKKEKGVLIGRLLTNCWRSSREESWRQGPKGIDLSFLFLGEHSVGRGFLTGGAEQGLFRRGILDGQRRGREESASPQVGGRRKEKGGDSKERLVYY